MCTIKGSLKPATDLLVLFLMYPGCPVKSPVVGSITSISSTQECCKVGAKRANAARAVAAKECILMSERSSI